MSNTGLHPSILPDAIVSLGTVGRMAECANMSLQHSPQAWGAMMDDPYGETEYDVIPGPYQCYAILGNISALEWTVAENSDFMFCFLKGYSTCDSCQLPNN